MAAFNDFRNDVKPNWCPGCGDFAVLTALQRATANTGLEPHELAVVSGIGCSGRISGYIYAYGFHATHGRALPIAQGLKMANRDLTVVACGGDGDGFAIGTGHTFHAIRRNVDITYIVMDNHIYGLTKGQTSPRSTLGFKTKTTPQGAIEPPLSVMEMSLAAGATFLAQGFSGDIKGLTSLIEQGIKHKGFAFINVFSPCVTFNKDNSYEWYKEHLTQLSTIGGYDTSNRMKAMDTLMEYQGLVTGLIYQDKERQSYQELVRGYSDKALIRADLRIGREMFEELVGEFR